MVAPCSTKSKSKSKPPLPASTDFEPEEVARLIAIAEKAGPIPDNDLRKEFIRKMEEALYVPRYIAFAVTIPTPKQLDAHFSRVIKSLANAAKFFPSATDERASPLDLAARREILRKSLSGRDGALTPSTFEDMRLALPTLLELTKNAQKAHARAHGLTKAQRARPVSKRRVGLLPEERADFTVVALNEHDPINGCLSLVRTAWTDVLGRKVGFTTHQHGEMPGRIGGPFAEFAFGILTALGHQVTRPGIRQRIGRMTKADDQRMSERR